MIRYFILAISFLIVRCGAAKQPQIVSSSTNPVGASSDYEPYFDVKETAPDASYGLSGENPVMVGGRSPMNQRRYLASLAGPNGEELEFHRRGSCCAYESENGLMGSALVDVYEVLYEGLDEPILIYISFYDEETLFVPKGFTKREL